MQGGQLVRCGVGGGMRHACNGGMAAKQTPRREDLLRPNGLAMAKDPMVTGCLGWARPVAELQISSVERAGELAGHLAVLSSGGGRKELHVARTDCRLQGRRVELGVSHVGTGNV